MPVILARHYPTKSNKLGLFGDGPLDDVPTEGGEEQARALGRRLQAGSKIDGIWHGETPRQAFTAKIIALELPYAIDKIRSALLHEQGVGEWSGKSKSADISPKDLKAWREGRLLPPGGESDEEFSVRMMEAWNSIIQPAARSAGNNLVVTSGSVIRFAVAQVLKVPWRNLLPAMDVDNCGLTTLRMARGKLFVASVNDVSHLKGFVMTPI